MRNKKSVPRIKWGAEPEFFGPRHYFRESLMIRYLTSCLKKGIVLDAGFGSGSLLMRLAKYNFKVKGIDLSEDFVKFVEKKLKIKNLYRQIEVKKGNLMKMDFPDDYFHGVVCGEILEHIKNDSLAVREMSRVLKKGGVFVMTVPANPDLWDINDERAGHYRRYKKSELKALLENNGFKVDRIESWGFPLARIWHRLIFLPLLEKKLNKPAENMKMFSKAAKLEKFSPLIANIFKIDNLFNRFPWGIGLIARAIKI